MCVLVCVGVWVYFYTSYVEQVCMCQEVACIWLTKLLTVPYFLCPLCMQGTLATVQRPGAAVPVAAAARPVRA